MECPRDVRDSTMKESKRRDKVAKEVRSSRDYSSRYGAIDEILRGD